MPKSMLAAVVAAVLALVAIFYFGQPSSKQTVKPPAVVKKGPASTDVGPDVVFHRVEQGGGQGPEQTCSAVKPFAEGKSPAELQALAKQYGVTVAELSKFLVCIP